MPPQTARTLIQPSPSSKTPADLTLLLHQAIPTPTPSKTNHDHLIHVHACSPCKNELLWPHSFPPPHPRALIPCPDVSGTVVSAPPDSPFPPGSEIYARTNYSRPGNARDYTIARTEELALMPRGLGMGWVGAAAVPVSAETAWQVLFVQAGVVVRPQDGDEDEGVVVERARMAWSGKRILVTGAAGSVGMWVVQIAVGVLGLEVVGVCGGEEKAGLVRGLGAREVVDYNRAGGVKGWVEGGGGKVDVVVDCVGGRALRDAWWVVKDGGTVVSIVQPPGEVCPWSERRGVKEVFFVMQPSGKQLGMITRWIEEGKCRGLVDSVWPLERFRDAFERLESGLACGKVVLDLSLNQ
ncbi:NAD(P)-binding protein [Aspergillus sclerotiicarbonarius CBS 121057]|uniref:NAD(P)-binding protein n=1 Tax=Aspergillus sclerotiicarbonarius (strain CBS 121057 / IBT 28362) TaxID=1448318 RepID=A0A319DZF5_ASPSB|nr:NAD(P)-binding protein [Aspergillus sclerotiicarbonarius CBS 121057]